MEEILKECMEVVDEICKKYGYNDIDREGNDSLKTVLIRISFEMVKGEKEEGRQLFYQMLRNTPIIMINNVTREEYNRLVEQYMGDIDSSIEIEEEESEYSKNIGVGAYVSKPIIDENMQLKGKRSFVYIQKADDKCKKLLGTDINVPHLIHELGHAWHAEEDEYSMTDDKKIRRRVGTAEFIYSFSKGKNGKVTLKSEKTTGLMIEEGMNTIEEEQAMANYMGVSLEGIHAIYEKELTKSSYQNYISSATRYMLQSLHAEEFQNWRLYGSKESKDRIEDLMKRTDYWKNRETDILSSSDSPRNYQHKRDVLNKINNPELQQIFSKNESVYFPDISKMSPIEKIDNVLTQYYNLGMNIYRINLKEYESFLNCLNYEIYSLINQSAELMKREELIDVVSGVGLTEMNEIIQETRKIMQGDKAKSNTEQRKERHDEGKC